MIALLALCATAITTYALMRVLSALRLLGEPR